MKNKKIIIIALLGIAFFISAHIYNVRYHEKVRRSPIKYIYETYSGPTNAVLIIEDLEYGDALIAYYKEIEKDSLACPIIKFPLKSISEPVYVVGQTEDGNLIEVVSYRDRGVYFGGSFLKGWVYKGTIHDKPAPKSD